MSSRSKNSLSALPRNVFDPGKLTAEEKSYLDRLLGNIEQATKERASRHGLADNRVLESWIHNPDWRRIAPGYIELLRPIDDERVKNAFESGWSHLDQNYLARIAPLPARDIKATVAYLFSNGVSFLDKRQERENKKEIASLYKTTLSRFPALLNNRNDINGAIRLGKLFKEQKQSLTDIWREDSTSQRLTATRSLLETAYPDDNVSHLHILNTASSVAGATYMPLFDTILFGPVFTREKTWSFSLFMLSHEYQHRRQHVLADQYKNGALEKGSPEYYQGRLYSANFSGGYVSPHAEEGAIAQTAGLIEYLDQPVEKQANDVASLSSIIGNTPGAVIWDTNEKFCRFFSRLAKPVDYVIRKIESGLTPPPSGNKPPLP